MILSPLSVRSHHSTRKIKLPRSSLDPEARDRGVVNQALPKAKQLTIHIYQLASIAYVVVRNASSRVVLPSKASCIASSCSDLNPVALTAS